MATYHSNSGKFCEKHKAEKVVKGGKRFVVRRVLEPEDDTRIESDLKSRGVFVDLPSGMIPLRKLFGGI